MRDRQQQEEEMAKYYAKQDAELFALNPNDVFEAGVIELVKMKRRKGEDYDRDGDIFTNFWDTATSLEIQGFGVAESILFNITQKLSRLRSLRRNGRLEDTSNETAKDTYMDLAVYALILWAYVKDR
jgi:hypothetical protein